MYIFEAKQVLFSDITSNYDLHTLLENKQTTVVIVYFTNCRIKCTPTMPFTGYIYIYVTQCHCNKAIKLSITTRCLVFSFFVFNKEYFDGVCRFGKQMFHVCGSYLFKSTGTRTTHGQ